jgi:hypothetical protein
LDGKWVGELQKTGCKPGVFIDTGDELEHWRQREKRTLCNC